MSSRIAKDLVPGRQEKIAQIVRERRMVRVSELCALTGASVATIRRDLGDMQGHGLLRKVHGGALAVERGEEEPLFDDKAAIAAREKQQIAQAAAAYVKPHDTVFLDGGSTVLALAALLRAMRGLTVVTNSLRVALTLPGTGPRLIMVGGELRALSQTFVGPLTAHVLERLHVDTAFMGTVGAAEEEGLTTTDPREAFTKQLVIQHAQRVILLADSGKIGKISFVCFGAIGDVDAVITDRGAPRGLVQRLRKKGVQVVVA